MTSEHVDAPIVGSLHASGDTGTVRIEHHFGTDARDLWSALTEPGRLGRWLGEFEGELVLGGQYSSRFFSSGAEATGRVVECESPQRFTVVTKGVDASNEQVVRADLTAQGEETLLVIEQRGLPSEWLAVFGAGLQVHVEDLASHIVGGERCDSDARMGELVPVWQAKVVDR